MKFLLRFILTLVVLDGFTSCKPPSPSTQSPTDAPPSLVEQTGPVTLIAAAPPAVAARVQGAPVPTPHPASGATEAAIRLYPELGKKDSMFNRAFRDLYNHKKKTDPGVLSVPDWPIALAEQTALMLKIAPTNAKTVASVAVVPGKIAAAASPSPSWIEERKQRTGALDLPAYDQRRVIYGRYYYYYGPNGRYWVDQYGRRQYY